MRLALIKQSDPRKWLRGSRAQQMAPADLRIGARDDAVDCHSVAIMRQEMDRRSW